VFAPALERVDHARIAAILCSGSFVSDLLLGPIPVTRERIRSLQSAGRLIRVGSSGVPYTEPCHPSTRVIRIRRPIPRSRLEWRRLPFPLHLRFDRRLVRGFHRLYYDAGLRDGTWADTRWLGIGVSKCPLDLWVYQEILDETRPDLLVETGTFDGGSALYFASLFDLLGRGRVVTIDVDPHERLPEHERITYLTGSSVAPEIRAQVEELAAKAERVMVVLDSDHSRDHVLSELRAYGELVTSGCYLVVEDTNVNGHPAWPGFGPGPMEAVEEFLAEDSRFVVDRAREKLLLTFNPSGWLLRR